MKSKLAVLITSALVIATASAAHAGGKPTGTSSNKPSAAAVTSAWLAPKAGVVNKVSAGSTIPLKFRLANAGTEIRTTAGVSVTANAVACPTPSPSATPATPAPVATGTLAFVKPGNSSKTKAFRYSGNSFMYEWKTAANAMLGCYTFTVSAPGGITLPGPTVQIIAKS